MNKRTTSKKKARFDVPQQAALFELTPEPTEPEPGDLNIDIKIRSAISQAIRKSGMDRYDICAEMSKLTGTEVTKYMLDIWSAESKAKSGDSVDFNGNKRWGIPAELVPAFCHVTGEYRLLDIILEPLHYRALHGEDLLSAKLGQVIAQTKALERQRKQIEKLLAEGAR